MIGIKDKSASLGLSSPPPTSRRSLGLGLGIVGSLTIDDSSNGAAESGDENSSSCWPMPSEKSCSRASTSKQQVDIERELNVIKSFVFLDLESSALLPCERPKITEICLIAVHRSSIEGSSNKNSTSSPPVIPRVVDKLTLCLYPNKQIYSGDITGLDNSILLENEKKGLDSNLVDCINAFLNRQTKPVCLVAHNGERFDFPLLKTELNYIDCSLPCDVLCVDSLIAFQDLDDKLEEVQSQKPDILSKPSHSSPTSNNNTLPVTSSTSNEHSPSKKRKVSYKLAEIYKRTFGKLPENVHNAEADVITLIQIVCRHHAVCNWIDKNAKPWKNINLYYAPSPRRCTNKLKQVQV